MKPTMKPLIGTATLFIAATVGAQGLPPPPVSPTPVTTYEYDAQGNRTKITRGAGTLNLETKLTYDPLYRVKDNTDPKSGKTSFEYDGGDRTTQVTDPRNLVTQYPRDGFGNATQLISPDTGQASHTFDEAGNLLTRIDSRGVLTTYSYDAGDRPTSSVSTLSGQPSESVTWTYSQTGPGFAYGIGRLTSTAHPSGSSQYRYNGHGQVVTDTQRVQSANGANAVQLTHAVTYGYTLGDLSSTTYPSGRVASLTLLRGRVQTVSLAKDAGSTAVALITNLRWEPFERAVSSWQWNTTGGPLPHERFYDLSERITRYRLGNVFRDVRYDEASRIASFTHLLPDGTPQPALDQSFTHDENNRLTGITTATSSWSISYDPNGNRANLSLNGSLSTYNVEPTSNRLTSITNPARSFGYDNTGNTTLDSAGYTATYNLRGQLATITKGGVTTTYTYNAAGQRVRKVSSTGPASTVIFVHDQGGHLLGEYDQNGAAIREYVWLRDTPIAVFVPDPTNPNGEPLVYYIHTDHLNTPRVVVDKNNATRWRWLAEPFGTTAPEVDPNGLGSFTFNLRFPGQYADAESGLFYNYFRYYAPDGGAYRQSDPIGLGGGINTYGYAGGSPTQYVDPRGLFFDEGGVFLAIPAVVGATVAIATAPAWAVPAAIGTAVVAGGAAIYLAVNGGDPTAPTTGPSPVLSPAPDTSDSDPKEDSHAAYHRICDQPPPPNLDKCEFMRWKIKQLAQCVAARQSWGNLYGLSDGQRKQIRQKTKEKETWERRLNNAWDCKKDCP